jgi:hypothetical protein
VARKILISAGKDRSQIVQFILNMPMALLCMDDAAWNCSEQNDCRAQPNCSQHVVQRLEAEVIRLFVQLGRIIGQPRSYAEIYAVIFMAHDPLTMEELIERLGTSKGSPSQGLSFRRKAGAIRTLMIPRRFCRSW